ncbi:class I SAM-dependent methyltransferase [Candidatus Marsarchaeota archaeon]|nr:class I SAM-dependent methyltransferase [Candidatus Marsarchaeota archaeon]MCL5404847.1 class I SAM-dependent methyltransferase [Candidatus Marsarchaeota archaeon]
MIKDIKKLYSEYWKHEQIRLKQDPYHSIEFSTTYMFLEKYLPKSGIVLDAGGGTGIYAIGLAMKGYDVTLLDISRHNIAVAKKDIKREGVKEKVKAMVGDITDLSEFKDSAFDAVLCLGGPLSLVYGKYKRRKAISELVRVAKPSAPIFISVMNRYGSMSLAPSKWPDEVATSNFESVATKGEDRMWIGKYYCHFFSPEEFVSEFERSSKGAKIINLAGLEGLATPSINAINELAKNKKAWKNWLDMHYRLCTKPEVVGISAHMLLVARKA